MPGIQTTVATANASRYLQQLCKHFAHKVEARFDATRGEVDFPFGDCRLWADAERLKIECVSETEETLARTKFVVHDHLERFSWREKPEIVWQPKD